MKRITSYVPNTITCMNLIAGCLATIYALRFDQMTAGLHGYEWAWIWIGAAAVFDFLDGFAARMLKAYSDLGKQLDSLSDLVSFGVAPAALVFALLSRAEGAEWMSYFALFIPVMGALRLARFNIDSRQSTTFYGLPIPANAIFWIGAVAWAIKQGPSATPVVPFILFFFVWAISLLMVSNVRMFSLKFKNLDLRENFPRFTIVIAAILLVAFFGVSGLAWTILLYIAMSLVLPPVQ